jgi:beta-lactamase class A
MRSTLLALATLALALLGTADTMAGDREIATIKTLLGTEPVDTSLFAPEFLTAVPPASLEQVVTQVREQIGPVTAVEGRGGPDYLVETATHELPVQIFLDAGNRIAGLLFRPAVAKSADIDALLAEMQNLAPAFGLTVTADEAVLHAVQPDRPLAVGSAFKLGVLKALQADIAAGRRAWSDVVELTEADKSLPSGTLQTWPTGSPLTLHSLAALMISISDNTATDTLIRVLGRTAVEDALGIAPVLTTRELFTLKAEPELRARYRAGNLEAQRQVLADLASKPLPDASQVNTPYDPAMEWNLSATTLCQLIQSVADLDVMQINPGVASASDWQSVAFKGGSEIGVLNLTTLVTATSGTRYCIAATWNSDTAVDQARATGGYANLLAILKRR